MEIGNFPPVWRIVTRKNEPRPKILARPGQGTNTFFGGGQWPSFYFSITLQKKEEGDSELTLCVGGSPAFGGNL